MLKLHQCYEVLGVRPHASAQDVRRAYLEQVKRWHPDSQQHANTADHDRFLQIQAAYEQIKRHQQTSVARQSQAPETRPPASSVQTAEKLYDKAILFARQGLYQNAIAELSLAIQLDPDYALAYKYRGHLEAYLGLAEESQADLKQAEVLDRLHASAPYQAPSACDDAMYSDQTVEVRSPCTLKTHDDYGLSAPSLTFNLNAWSGAMVCAVFVMLAFIGDFGLVTHTRLPLYSQPTRLESPLADHY